MSGYGTIGETLVSEEALQARVREMAAQVSADYEGRDMLVIGVLKGAVFFIADLLRHLTVPCELDFMAVSSYGSSTHSSGVVRILKDLEMPIAGRHVLVVEDVIDSGLTLSYLLKNLASRQPASLEICSLLTKPGHKRLNIPIRYVGFDLPDAFVIGYGLDYAERWRNLPYIAILEL
jgi:hypoxanthine phosphoribosyltransferase